jgi:phosphomevalonate kinase
MYLQQHNLKRQKLGLGSSAALLIATYGALCRLHSGLSPEFTIANTAHRASQGGVGSGLDLAASLRGGLLRFQQGSSQPCQWPTELHYRFVYVGQPASTGKLVGSFYQWCDGGTPATVQILINAALKLADEAINLDNFDRYIHALRKMDEAATIGIYSIEHQYVATAAQRHGVLYKPCGAGGGDLGVALSDDPSKLRLLTEALERDHNNFAIIELEIATHGLTVA